MDTNLDRHGPGPGNDPGDDQQYDANILVVDDEPELSRALSKLLGRNGYHVLTAGNGEEGLEILRREEIHLVLSDLQMPRMGGLDLLKAAQVVAPNTEFVIITGHGTIETAVDAMRTGAYDFIEKPFSITTTLKVVRKALEKQHLIAENRDLRKRLAEIQGRQRDHRQQRPHAKCHRHGQAGGGQQCDHPAYRGERNRQGGLCHGDPRME